MKIIKRGVAPELAFRRRVVCRVCGSELEIELVDLWRDSKGIQYRCPVCTRPGVVGEEDIPGSVIGSIASTPPHLRPLPDDDRY